MGMFVGAHTKQLNHKNVSLWRRIAVTYEIRKNFVTGIWWLGIENSPWNCDVSPAQIVEEVWRWQVAWQVGGLENMMDVGLSQSWPECDIILRVCFAHSSRCFVGLSFSVCWHPAWNRFAIINAKNFAFARHKPFQESMKSIWLYARYYCVSAGNGELLPAQSWHSHSPFASRRTTCMWFFRTWC